jgi:hypothetical protein
VNYHPWIIGILEGIAIGLLSDNPPAPHWRLGQELTNTMHIASCQTPAYLNWLIKALSSGRGTTSLDASPCAAFQQLYLVAWRTPPSPEIEEFPTGLGPPSL